MFGKGKETEGLQTRIEYLAGYLEIVMNRIDALERSYKEHNQRINNHSRALEILRADLVHVLKVVNKPEQASKVKHIYNLMVEMEHVREQAGQVGTVIPLRDVLDKWLDELAELYREEAQCFANAKRTS